MTVLRYFQIVALIPILVVHYSCTDNSEKQPEEKKLTDSLFTKNEKENPGKPGTASDTNSIEKKWDDSNGYNELVISDFSQGEFGIPGWKQWLLARKFTGKNSTDKKPSGSFTDSLIGFGQVYVILENNIKTIDLNADGANDIYFSYALMNVEGLDPDRLNFVFNISNGFIKYSCSIDQEIKTVSDEIIADIFRKNSQLENLQSYQKELIRNSIRQFIDYKKKNVEG